MGILLPKGVLPTEQRLSILQKVFVFLFLLLIIRLFWWSVLSHDTLSKEAAMQRVATADLVTVRGSIKDRNGLSFTDCSEGEFAVWNEGVDIEEGASVLSEQLGLDKTWVTQQLQNRNTLTFGPLNNLYPVERVGFMTFRSPIRQDNNALARHLIGMTDGQGKGISGLEAAFESVLNTGRKHTVVSLRDVRRNLLKRWGYLEANRQMDTAQNLHLTLDKPLQQALEELADTELERGSILVSEVASGDVLASVSRPQFNPYDLSASLKSEAGEFLNRSFSLYNAGSVFKTVVAAASLEYSIGIGAFHCTGTYRVGDREVTCYDCTAHGWVTIDEAYAKSCNGYFVCLGEKLGMERLLEMATRLGLSKPATNYPADVGGQLPDINPRLPGRVANFSVGQGELLVTPAGMLRLTDIVANGGMLRTLNVCDSIRDGQGLTLQSLRQPKGERVLSGHTVKRLREMMALAVKDGTGKEAANSLTTSAGKTGTAETGWTEDGALQVHGWFCGFFPAENPKYCITVFLENGQSGGRYAAPLFSKASEILLKNFKKI